MGYALADEERPMERIPLSSTYRRVVQLELNEISEPVISKMISEGDLPSFASLDKGGWTRYTTTSEKRYEQIEPWIQWVTAHTGQTFDQHGIFRLGDSRRLQTQQIWEVLSEHGIESGILGSMNGHRGTATGGLFFPDPWAKENDAYPADLRPLWELISRQVQQHAVQRTSKRAVAKGALAFLKYQLPPRLYASIAKELAASQLQSLSKWRLAGIFDRLLVELFLSVASRTDFGFYTLFLNSVAHYQHHFWREFDPERFDGAIHSPDCAEGHDPIRRGYRMFDKTLGRCLDALDDPDTLVIVAGGLSQIPYAAKEGEGGMNYWRLKDHRGFAQRLGLRGGTVYPLMSRDCQIDFGSTAERDRAKGVLEGLTIDGHPLLDVRDNGDAGLFFETGFTRGAPAEAQVLHASGEPVGRFHDLYVNIAIKSGHHSGKGMLWVRDCHERTSDTVPLACLPQVTFDALGVPASL